MNSIGEIPPDIKADERQLLLFWALHSPLTVTQMADRGFLGDPGLRPESYERTFRRICRDFAENGIRLEALSLGGESAYRVDREATYVNGTVPTQEELLELVVLLGTYLDGSAEGSDGGRGGDPYLDSLRRARDKLACTGCDLRFAGGSPTLCDEASLRGYALLIDSYINRRGVMFHYTDSAGRPSERDVDIYGVFRHDGHAFFVGMDMTRGGVRAFRDDRIDLLAVKPLPRRFEVPEDFCIESHEGLPFEYGSDDFEAVFEAAQGQGPDEGLRTLTGSSGTWEDGCWKVHVRDLDAACSWSCTALEHGMRPCCPDRLVGLVREGLLKVVDMHE